MKIVKKVQLKIVIVTSVVNPYILHGRVFVMIEDQTDHNSLLLSVHYDNKSV